MRKVVQLSLGAIQEKLKSLVADTMTEDVPDGRTEFEIELKDFDGATALREIARVLRRGKNFTVVDCEVTDADGYVLAFFCTRRA